MAEISCSVAPSSRGAPIASTQKCTHQFSTRSRYSSTISSAPGCTKLGCAIALPAWWTYTPNPPPEDSSEQTLRTHDSSTRERCDVLGTDRRAPRRAAGTDDRREIGLVVQVAQQGRRHHAGLGRHLVLVVDVLAQQPLAVAEHVADEALEVLRRAVGADLAAHGNAGGSEQVQPARARHARAADHRRLIGDRHDRARVGVAEVRIGRVGTGVRERQPRGEDGAGAEHRRALACRGRALRGDVAILDRRVTSGVNGHVDASCAASAPSQRAPRSCSACRVSVPARGSTDQGRAGEKSPAMLSCLAL